MGGKVGENPAALRAAVFSLSSKNLRGGAFKHPPAGRGLIEVSIAGEIQGLKVECLLTLAIWSYGHEAEQYIFLNLPFPSNPKESSSICCILSTPEQNLL